MHYLNKSTAGFFCDRFIALIRLQLNSYAIFIIDGNTVVSMIYYEQTFHQNSPAAGCANVQSRLIQAEPGDVRVSEWGISLCGLHKHV